MKKRIIYWLLPVLFCSISFGIVFGVEYTRKIYYSVLLLDQLDLSLASGESKAFATQSVGGNRLKVGDKTFDHGFGQWAPGEVGISLPTFRGRFTAWVGIDNEVGSEGAAEFFVLIDDQIVWQSGTVRGGEEAKFCEVPFDVALARRRLTLRTQLKSDSAASRHCDWGDAMIEVDAEMEATRNIRIELPYAGIVDESGNLIDPINETAREFLSLSQELRRGIPPHVAAQALRPEANFLPEDRDPVDVVLRRTRALLENLQSFPDTTSLEEEAKQLSFLDSENKRIEIASWTQAMRKNLFSDAVTLRKRIALKNPLLDFNDVLLIKRHFQEEPETEGNHMCDQFFGFNAQPGGGLFLVKNLFSAEGGETVDLLAQSQVTNGRYKGTKLDSTWSFLAPDLSFDGQRIVFAATDTKSPRHAYINNENNTFHLFSVDIAGKNLVQLTDGAANDIDPCFLPNGRIAFISERRGGYGRCHGRPVPSYTLHSMNGDGSDIVMLSPHETNEWKPSVDHHGMIIYTRWDYVDRGFNQAHHPWITTPDGRDSRALQGNYSPVEAARPHLEATLRAVPDSNTIVGVAAMHHGQYFGSVILLDTTVADDGAMSSVRRVTPEQPFPESESRPHIDPSNYGQPFPLSDDYYLCVYDAFSGMGKGANNNFGLYLLDSFGNKILLYRDPTVSVQCPIPVRERPVPPILPNKTLVGLTPAELAGAEKTETPLPDYGIVGLSNVYDGKYPFPEGTKIKELRIYQLLPKTTYYRNIPTIGYGDLNGARAFLGTVPVEEDGSAYFQMPVDIPVYFQAIDDEGLAVTSMRSATYIKPGETLFCNGCHEERYSTFNSQLTKPKAFGREPSEIKPSLDGTNPFSFMRLIQPILDKHCVDCHATESAAGKTFPLDAGKDIVYADTSNIHHAIDIMGRKGTAPYFPPSYTNLRDYAFYFSGNSYTEAETIPNQFGAKVSRLWKLLQAGHYDVTLTPAEKEAITIWLDSNSDFFGTYEQLDAQRRGEVVYPILK